jgi:response regulator of citrate/malate metabolism
VRSAIGLGAMYYLVKPFGLDQLREQLGRYRRWRSGVAAAGAEPDQDAVDNLFALRHAPAEPRLRSGLPPTMARVLQTVAKAPHPLSAADIAADVGISRPTAQRYLSDLERRGLITLQLQYGTTGRPTHHYRLARRTR